jgi:hypothetical protein
MTGKKENGTPWRQTSVVIRADIFEQARKQEIDINDVCNQALADRLGIDYRQQKIPEIDVPEPVFIAPNAAPAQSAHTPAKPGAPLATAIINADDPHAAKAVKSRNLPKERPALGVPAVPAPALEKEVVSPRPIPAPEKAKKPAPSRKKKEDSAKKFFASVIIREDAETARVTKDEMYQEFERWCRDHNDLTIPDKKSFAVMLKNQFAVKEKMVDGTPTWVGVRLKK